MFSTLENVLYTHEEGWGSQSSLTPCMSLNTLQGAWRKCWHLTTRIPMWWTGTTFRNPRNRRRDAASAHLRSMVTFVWVHQLLFRTDTIWTTEEQEGFSW